MPKEIQGMSPEDRFIIVDNEASILEGLRRGLRPFDIKNVLACSSAADAFAAYQANPSSFRLLLTDLQMPGMTGVQLLQRIRAFESEMIKNTLRPRLKIILMTGYHPNVHKLDDAKALGADGFMQKPFATGALISEMQRVLALP
ncbi:MAG: response regulator [Patescibacteria group bacterium]